MARVFISYSRKNIEFVRRLHDALTEGGRDCWVDWEGIPPTTEWLAEIRSAIDGADGVIFIITPDSCASDVCRLEIAHAVERRKRLIPVLHREISHDACPPDIAKLNWIFLREQDAFASGMATITMALDTDFEWVADHTRLLVRAVEWDREKRDASYGLRGRDLERFERWLGAAPDKTPEATSLQSEYVLASRRAAIRRQRTIWSSIFAGVTVALVLSLVAYFQSRQRAWQQRLGEGRQLVNESEAIRSLPVDSAEAQGQLEESARVAMKALQIFEELGTSSVEGDQALRTSLTLLPIRGREQRLDKETLGRIIGTLHDASFDPMGRYLAIGFGGRWLTMWDTRLGKQVATCDAGGISLVKVAASSSGELVAAASLEIGATNAGAIEVWRVADCQRVVRVADERRTDRLIFDPKGRWVGRLAALRLAVWDVRSGAPIPTPFDGAGPVFAAAPDPSGDRLAIAHRQTGEQDVRMSIWNIPERTIAAAWALEERPSSIRWTADASRLLVGNDKLVRIHEIESGETLARLPVRKDTTVGSVDGNLVAAELGNYAIEIREPLEGTARSRIALGNELATMAFRQDDEGPTLVTLNKLDHRVSDWRAASGAIAQLTAPSPIERVSFSGDSIVAHTTDQKVARAWKLSDDSQRFVTVTPAEGVVTDRAIPQFRVTTSGLSAQEGVRHWVRVTRISDGSEMMRDFDHPIIGTALSGDESTLAVTSGRTTRGGFEGATLLIWRLATNQTLATPLAGLQDGRLALLLAMSHTDRYVGIPSRRGFTMFDGKTLQPLVDLLHPFPSGITFQPSGTLVAIAGSDRRTRVWDLASRAEIARVIDNRPVKNLTLSPDGRWLATVTDDGIASVWAVTPRDLIRQACARLAQPCP